MMAFGEYAKYYDLLYADKDYAAETAFVREIIRRLAPGARTLLELGCGSARHALELVRNRFTVTGVDLSAQMIARAHAQVTQLPLELRSRIKLMQGHATRFVSATPFEVKSESCWIFLQGFHPLRALHRGRPWPRNPDRALS